MLALARFGGNGVPHVFKLKYRLDDQGQVRRNGCAGARCSLTRASFNANGYTTREVYSVGRNDQINVSCNRDSQTNNLKDETVTCAGTNQTRRLTAPVGPARSGEFTADFLMSLCQGGTR